MKAMEEVRIDQPLTPSNDPRHEGPEGSACECSNCGLYRWYPPLLVLSTIMAGVFCWMYISKPVFVAQPQEQEMIQALPADQEARPGVTRESHELPPTAAVTSSLDPGAGSLPGEPESLLGGDTLLGEADLLNSPIGGGSLQPIVVRREGQRRPLFRAGPPSAFEQEEAEAGEVPPVAEAGGSAEVGPEGPGEVLRSNEETFQVAPSMAAEFFGLISTPVPSDGATPEESEIR